MNFLKSSHRLFIVMILIKGLEWIIQISIWVMALLFTRESLYSLVWWYLQEELIEDHHAIVSRFLLESLQWLTISTQHFIAFYFISHGIIKFFIWYSILKKRYWAYPFALIIFSFFTFYQVYLYIQSWSLWMIGLIAIDIVVSILTYIEYQSVKKAHIHQ